MTYLERHDDAQNVHCYYAIDVSTDLFGAWVVTRNWGRVGSLKGRTRRTTAENEGVALQVEITVLRAKLGRGYLQI